MAYKNGIDFSAGCGKSNLSLALQGLDFCYFRCAWGTQIDAQYENNKRQAVELGVPWGVYQYFLPQRPYKKQADLLVELAQVSTLPAWADFETNQGMNKNYLVNVVEKYMKLLGSGLAKPPVIYTSPGWWNSYMPRTNYAKGYELAVAHWNRYVPWPTLPYDWNLRRYPIAWLQRNGWLFWQWSKRGRVAGIDAQVDLIRIQEEKFKKLVGDKG